MTDVSDTSKKAEFYRKYSAETLGWLHKEYTDLEEQNDQRLLKLGMFLAGAAVALTLTMVWVQPNEVSGLPLFLALGSYFLYKHLLRKNRQKFVDQHLEQVDDDEEKSMLRLAICFGPQFIEKAY